MARERLPSISTNEWIILNLLQDGRDSDSTWWRRPAAVSNAISVYVTLARMEAKGFVESEQEERQSRRDRTSTTRVPGNIVWCESARRLPPSARRALTPAGTGQVMIGPGSRSSPVASSATSSVNSLSRQQFQYPARARGFCAVIDSSAT